MLTDPVISVARDWIVSPLTATLMASARDAKNVFPILAGKFGQALADMRLPFVVLEEASGFEEVSVTE